MRGDYFSSRYVGWTQQCGAEFSSLHEGRTAAGRPETLLHHFVSGQAYMSQPSAPQLRDVACHSVGSNSFIL